MSVALDTFRAGKRLQGTGLSVRVHRGTRLSRRLATALAALSIGGNLQAAVAIVHCPRSEPSPKGDLVAKAECDMR
jgi:hypothetical protein